MEGGGMCLFSVQGSVLQSPEESTVLPLILFCLLSVQCAGHPEQLRWYGDGVLASVPIWAVCLCAVQRGARGRLTTRQHPRLDPGHDQEPASLGAPPLPLPAPPSCTGCKLNLIRGSLPSQSYFTFAHPSLDIHLRNRGQY